MKPVIKYCADLTFLGEPVGPGWVCESPEGRGTGSTKKLAYMHWVMNTRPQKLPVLKWWQQLFNRKEC